MVFIFNELEYLLEKWICQIFHDNWDEIWMMIVSNMSYAEKITLLDKYNKRILCLDKSKNKKEIDSLKKIVSDLRDCGNYRNQLVHWYWHLVTKNKEIQTKTSIGDDWIEYKLVKVWVLEIKKIVTYMNKTISSLDSFYEKIWLCL